jgi:hypothetical protein
MCTLMVRAPHHDFYIAALRWNYPDYPVANPNRADQRENGKECNV